MSIITHRFEKTTKVLTKVVASHHLHLLTTNLPYIISDLDAHVSADWRRYNRHVKALYILEKEIDDWCRAIDQAELHNNHIQNIEQVEQSLRHQPLEPLNWKFIFNPNTCIIKTTVDYVHLLAAMEGKVELVTDTDFAYFIRPSFLQQDAFLEVKLVDWNLLLLDLYECDTTFTGQEIYELLLTSTAFESKEHLKKQVVEFLRIQLIYLNSLMIIES